MDKSVTHRTTELRTKNALTQRQEAKCVARTWLKNEENIFSAQFGYFTDKGVSAYWVGLFYITSCATNARNKQQTTVSGLKQGRQI